MYYLWGNYNISCLQIYFLYLKDTIDMEYIDFETGFMRDLKNNTYISVYCRIIDRMEEAKFKHSHLSDSIELLKRHGIENVGQKPESKHINTPQIQKLHKERRKQLAKMRDIIDQISSDEDILTVKTARALQSFMKPLRNYIGSRNVNDEREAVYTIERGVDYFDEYNSALREINLLPFIERLIKCNNEILKLESERDEDNSASVLGNERKLKSYRDLNMVLEVLNSAIELGKDDCELAFKVGESINMLLRRERGYVRMVETKKKG